MTNSAPVTQPGLEADDVRRAERVAGDRLEDRAGDAQRRAAHERGDHAREPQLLTTNAAPGGPSPSRVSITAVGESAELAGADRDHREGAR